MNAFYRFLRCAALMALMMSWMMPAKAQHPFTLTTPDDVTNHTETLYWIESKGATGFYMIPKENGEDKEVSTSNMPNEMMLWYFMDAGIESNIQYYYIVNKSTGKYLRLKGNNGADGSIGIKTYVDNDNTYKFSIQAGAYQWVIQPYSSSSHYVNKKGSNVNYTSGLKSSTANGTDVNSNWNFVQKSSVTWAHPFTNSSPSVKHYYLVQNRHKDYTSFYMSTDASGYVTVSNEANHNRIWYFEEASSDASIPNMKYYYIINAVTGDYMYFNSDNVTGASLSNVFKIQAHSVGVEDNYQFAIVNAIGTSYSAFAIMPKQLIGLYNDKFTSLGTSTMSNNERMDTSKDRGSDNNTAHWVFTETSYSLVEEPTITNNDGTISMSTTTPDATIYYTTNGNTPDNTSTEYTEPFPLGDATVIKAIAYLGSDFSTVCTYRVPTGNDYPEEYLTFNVRTGGIIPWKSFGTVAKEISYSINGGSWTSITAGDNVTISVDAGDAVRFKGSNSTYATDKNNYSGFDAGSDEGAATYDISGNIMSLVYGDNFVGETTLSGTYNFCSLFKQSKAVSAENLILPATSLTECCYRAMFSKCRTLEVAPALPATTLAANCYWYLFEECAITTAPELPAPALVSNCYGNMFTGCTQLNYIKCLATTGFNSNGCLTNWVYNVSSTGTFLKAENASWPYGASGIPSGWDEYVTALVDPVITCDGDFITITCPTYGASIYYRLGETGSYSLYSTPIAIHESTVVEAYAERDESQSNIVSENCIAIKTYRFAGMKMTPGPLYYGSDGYEIKEDWNHDSYHSVYGKTVGSTYFSFIELGQLYESSLFSTADGDIEKVLDPLDGWRVPTNTEWASILGTTRSGSTVNGTSNSHYAMIELTDVSGWLIFPDGETITGVALSNMDNTTPNTGITASQLDDYLSQGCVFLPGSGCYDGGQQTWGDGHYYWSSAENNSSTGYVSSGDIKDKETYYLPVYLVKDAADEATRLLKTWTYNNNEVELPYSVNAMDGHSGSYARGTFTFTTEVKVKESQPTYLWFQHADQSAEVYIDNTLVEKHWGGYNAFFVDITDYVHCGTNNIKVAIKNNEGNQLAPNAGDFNFNATLGEVKLISSPVVPDTAYGYDGFHITSTVTAEEATITVKTKVPTSATLTCSIKGTNCDYSETQTVTGEDEITFTTTITNPHLWNGTLDPYLYEVTLTIEKDDVVYHTFKRGYGLRFFEYVIDKPVANGTYTGFMLNGSPYLLRGVCMHNDLEGKANALTAADMDNDFEILKELGCNFVRLAHYPHPKEVYDWCDRLGIIVQTEVPCVNKMQSTLPGDYYSHLTMQYKDMVNQHYNHPCIIFWGLSNETTTDDKEFAKEKINEYITLIKDLDSSRLVGYVMSHSVDDPSGYYNDPDADWFGCNIYVGWYIDQNSNNPTSRLTTRLNKTLTRKSKPLAFSEYGCGGTQSCHSDDFMTTTTRGNNPRHDIEYQMWLHEGHIAAIKNHPQLLFTSQWQLFDIAVSDRQEGYTICLDGEHTSTDDNLKYLNNKGLVERDHKTKKDPFYLYKAWWNQKDKFVHICGKDYEKLTGRVIKCYTNDGSALTLFVNNVEIQTVTVVNNIATFTAIDFHPGDVVRVNGATTNDAFAFTNYSYVFTTEGDWNVAANWTPAGEPAAADNVTINAACTIPAAYTAQANHITIGENGSLTIAEGGQLYHNNEGVMATVQKPITAYTTDKDGWHLIGYSFAGDGTIAEMDNLLDNEYDLYYYDEPTHYWMNHENPDNNFTELEAARGYLYANSADVTIGLKGFLKAGNDMVNHPLSYTDNIPLAGFNLVANPFAHNVTSFTGSNISSEVYRMNDCKTDLMVSEVSADTPLLPGEGFFVKATADGASVTFNSGAKDGMKKSGRITLEIREDNRLVDRLIVKREGEPLEKLTLRENGTKIFALHNNKEMAVVPIEGNEQAIYFEAAKNGTYTISVNLEGVEMMYLHLIDNMTGADLDLLSAGDRGSEPAMRAEGASYTFTAKTTDYAGRFKLVFSASENANENENFAFISNGNLIVNGEGMLQVVDVLGRVVVSREVIPHSAFKIPHSPGVYVLCLINGNEVKTQKIVVR